MPLDSTIGVTCSECTDTERRRLVCLYHQGWADATDYYSGDLVERLLTAIETAAAVAEATREVLNR